MRSDICQQPRSTPGLCGQACPIAGQRDQRRQDDTTVDGNTAKYPGQMAFIWTVNEIIYQRNLPLTDIFLLGCFKMGCIPLPNN